MLRERTREALTVELKAEFYSSDLCLALSACCQSIKQKIRLMGDASGTLFMLDRKLALRQFTMLSMQAEGG